MPRKRYSSESNQETISRRQFGELINDQMHWITSDTEPDIGEDILIRICRDGIPTGISFQVQLKSVKGIGEKLLKDGKTITYRFDTDTLLHWDVQLIPVYIVIWDIATKRGWFLLVKDAIKWLDEKSPNWTNQSSVAIHIQITNVLNRSNLLSIQTLLTKKLGPTILKDKQLIVNAEFSFTKKEEDQEKLKQLQEFFNAGDAVELDGKYITKWDIPDAWKRLYGEPELEKMHIQLRPKKSEQNYPAQIEISSPLMGFERIDYIEPFIIKQGQKEVTFSNAGQAIPYEINMVFITDNNSIKINFTINFPNLDAIEANKAVRIQKILSSGGIITLKFINETGPSKIPFTGVQSFAPPKEFEDFVSNIYKIMLETNQSIFLRDGGLFSYEDYKNANELVSILDSGTYGQSGLIANIGIQKPWIQMILDTREKSDRLEFKTMCDESCIDILGTHFELGQMIQFFKGYWDMPSKEVNQWLLTAGEEDSLDIKLHDVELFEEFPNWSKNI